MTNCTIFLQSREFDDQSLQAKSHSAPLKIHLAHCQDISLISPTTWCSCSKSQVEIQTTRGGLIFH